MNCTATIFTEQERTRSSLIHELANTHRRQYVMEKIGKLNGSPDHIVRGQPHSALRLRQELHHNHSSCSFNEANADENYNRDVPARKLLKLPNSLDQKGFTRFLPKALSNNRDQTIDEKHEGGDVKIDVIRIKIDKTLNIIQKETSLLNDLFPEISRTNFRGVLASQKSRRCQPQVEYPTVKKMVIQGQRQQIHMIRFNQGSRALSSRSLMPSAANSSRTCYKEESSMRAETAANVSRREGRKETLMNSPLPSQGAFDNEIPYIPRQAVNSLIASNLGDFSESSVNGSMSFRSFMRNEGEENERRFERLKRNMMQIQKRYKKNSKRLLEKRSQMSANWTWPTDISIVSDETTDIKTERQITDSGSGRNTARVIVKIVKKDR